MHFFRLMCTFCSNGSVSHTHNVFSRGFVFVCECVWVRFDFESMAFFSAQSFQIDKYFFHSFVLLQFRFSTEYSHWNEHDSVALNVSSIFCCCTVDRCWLQCDDISMVIEFWFSFIWTQNHLSVKSLIDWTTFSFQISCFTHQLKIWSIPITSFCPKYNVFFCAEISPILIFEKMSYLQIWVENSTAQVISQYTYMNGKFATSFHIKL